MVPEVNTLVWEDLWQDVMDFWSQRGSEKGAVPPQGSNVGTNTSEYEVRPDTPLICWNLST